MRVKVEHQWQHGFTRTAHAIAVLELEDTSEKAEAFGAEMKQWQDEAMRATGVPVPTLDFAVCRPRQNWPAFEGERGCKAGVVGILCGE